MPGVVATSDWHDGFLHPKYTRVRKDSEDGSKVTFFGDKLDAAQFKHEVLPMSDVLARVPASFRTCNRLREVVVRGEQLCYELEVAVVPEIESAPDATCTILINRESLPAVREYLWVLYVPTTAEHAAHTPYVRSTHALNAHGVPCAAPIKRLRAHLHIMRAENAADDFAFRDMRVDLDAHSESARLRAVAAAAASSTAAAAAAPVDVDAARAVNKERRERAVERSAKKLARDVQLDTMAAQLRAQQPAFAELMARLDASERQQALLLNEVRTLRTQLDDKFEALAEIVNDGVTMAGGGGNNEENNGNVEANKKNHAAHALKRAKHTK